MVKCVLKTNCKKITIPALGKDVRYTSRLSARSALFTDLSLLLSHQTRALNSVEYRSLVVEENVLSRTSISARKKIWRELKSRYILDATHPLFDAFWREWERCRADPEEGQTAYCLLALNDRLVADLGQALLFSLIRQAPSGVGVSDVRSYIERSIKLHPEVGSWSDKTKLAVAQKYLASIRDFGFAKGKQKKMTIRPALYGPPVRLLIRALRLNGVKDAELILSPIFRILAIDGEEVIDALSHLSRRGELRFKMQGDIVDLDLESVI